MNRLTPTPCEELEWETGELCRACDLSPELVTQWVEVGLLEPAGDGPDSWRFIGVSVSQLRRAGRLQRDLGINAPGVALVVELMEEVDTLRRRLNWMEGRRPTKHIPR